MVCFKAAAYYERLSLHIDQAEFLVLALNALPGTSPERQVRRTQLQSALDKVKSPFDYCYNQETDKCRDHLVRMYCTLANEHLKTRQYDQALKYYKKAAALDQSFLPNVRWLEIKFARKTK
jgi:tetratricopeptide (TPR) repeat protein